MGCEPTPNVFDRIARVLLPAGGHLLVLVEAYFDESGTHDGSKVMALAGYLFRQDKSEEMAAIWREFLAARGLPYFHMVDCAHGNPPFDKLDPKHRILVETRLIGLIKQFTVQGIGVTVDLEAFHRRFGEKSFLGTPYSLAFYLVTRGVAVWAKETQYEGKIAYFFEAGHASQSEANYLLGIGLRIPEIKAELHYAGHAFVEKQEAPQVQAADLFAWLLTKDRKCRAEGRPERKDYTSLAQHHHNVSNISDEQFDILEPLWNRQREKVIAFMQKEGIPVPAQPISLVSK